MTKVYLAGKIAKSDWRHDLVPGLRGEYNEHDAIETEIWRTVPMKHGFEYVGPYFVSCDHGCGHNGDHGWIGGTPQAGTGCIPDGVPTKLKTAELCRDAIKRCDVFFAWMDGGETAHGTLVEIGLAHAYGKTIVLASSWNIEHTSPIPRRSMLIDRDFIDEFRRPNCEYCAWSGHGGKGYCECGPGDPELWFAYQHASLVIHSDSATNAFDAFANQTAVAGTWQGQFAKCESPLEELFLNAYRDARLAGEDPLSGLVVQHPVTVNGKSYRLDFAIPEKKIAFEMDGYTYHGKDREHFNRDRRKDTELKLAGWDVHRFDGDLIRADPNHVLQLAAKLAEAR